MEEYKLIFANRLKQALYKRNMSQIQLCRVTGIPKSAMSQYVKGTFKPKRDRLELIARVLNVNEAWLMGHYGVEMEWKGKNSMDYKQLIYRLKQYEKEYRYGEPIGRAVFGTEDVLYEATYAINTLKMERDKALEELKDLKIMWHMFGGSEGITEAFCKASERDAAVEELRLDASCKTCRFGNGYHPECDNCVATRERKGIHHKNWQWRGLEESRHVKPTLSLRFHKSDFKKEDTSVAESENSGCV